MKWYESWAPYLVVTVDGSFAAITCVLLRNSTIMDVILPILIFFLLYPIAILSSYMWINGVGHEYICGVDWDKLDDNGKKSACKTIGMWMTLGIIVDMYGLALILFDLFLGIGVAIAGVVVTGIGFISVWVRKKGRLPARMFSLKASFILTMVVILALIPPTYISSELVPSEGVEVTLGEDSFSVKAPMFHHTFRYDDLGPLEFNDSFSKGKRIWGFNTDTICSGKYNNSVFGDYQLASYKAVKSCIVVYEDGKPYVFNQATEDATKQLYDELRNRVG